MTKEDFVALAYIRKLCEEKPYLLPKIIDSATAGVKDFASKQRDFGGKLGFAMTEVLNNAPQEKFGRFSRKDLFEMTAPWMEGTEWYEEKKDNP